MVKTRGDHGPLAHQPAQLARRWSPCPSGKPALVNMLTNHTKVADPRKPVRA